jgi:hypothetical protein
MLGLSYRMIFIIKEMAESLSNIERDVRYIGRDIKISSYTDDVTS